ncbi:MAG: heavy metal translocating P-type ATPase [Bacteroidetes bacterium]|nr:MAG: heavy metal translocating P-type ATPase [Bacteroidota bacterium]
MDGKEHSCVHCGADCGKHPVVWEGKAFCCNGCLSVYQLLNDHKLYNYYEIDEQPGIKAETTALGNKYAFLDKEEMRERFILFSQGGISRLRFYIPVIHCASCIWLLEHLQKLHKGIRNSHVHFTRKELDITFDERQISLRKLVELLHSIHYIPDLSMSLTDREEENKSQKKLLIKIGIAGFAFLNVMTYSLPAYFNGEPLEPSLQLLFSLLSYFLIVPVTFYSGSDYFASSLKGLRKGNISIDLPIALGISVLFIVSSYEILWQTGTGYCDSLAGLIFFLLVGKWYQSKTYEALSFERNYKSYFPIAVTRINRQMEESILLENIDEGDELIIRNKELIPADSVLIEGTGRIDYSFVTGESTPVSKEAGDPIYAGGRQMGELIRIKVSKKVSQSHLTRLWNQDRSYDKPGDSLKSLSDRISRYFTIVVISIALGGLIYWLLKGKGQEAIFVFTAVLIVACPCALALSIPFTFGNTMRIFGRRGLYIKNTDVIERLSHIDSIVFDKTGTLTRPNESEISYRGEKLSEQALSALCSLARQSTHPLSVALVHEFKELPYQAPDHFVEVSGRGMYGRCNGMDIRLGAAEYVCGKARQADEHGPEDGTIPRASIVHVSIDKHYAGYFSFRNQFREGISEVMNRLKTDFSLYLVSGDNAAEADRLKTWFAPENLHFMKSPVEKAGFIESLQEKGHRVLMTGDGLNDAGALMQSDVALTLANRVYHFSPASDAVLEADRFPSLARFIRFTKTALRIVKASFAISFLYNIIGISFALSGQLSPIVAAILMPISSVSVVSFSTLVTRILGRHALGKQA